jgi:hypothetical protein
MSFRQINNTVTFLLHCYIINDILARDTGLRSKRLHIAKKRVIEKVMALFCALRRDGNFF